MAVLQQHSYFLLEGEAEVLPMAEKDTDAFIAMESDGEEDFIKVKLQEEEEEEDGFGEEERGRNSLSSSPFSLTHWPRSFRYK